MACQEIDVMRQQVCARLHGTVTGWQWNLQSRYGDPRVYAAQKAEMNRVDAEVQHDLSRRNSALLDDAYERQRQKIRQTHNERMIRTRSKLRDDRTKDKPPQSRAKRSASRTEQPLDAPPPDAAPNHPHPS